MLKKQSLCRIMSDLEFDLDWLNSNTKSHHPSLNMSIALRYEKSAEKLTQTCRKCDVSLKRLLKNKYYDVAILTMKLNREYKSENLMYICEKRNCPL